VRVGDRVLTGEVADAWQPAAFAYRLEEPEHPLSRQRESGQTYEARVRRILPKVSRPRPV